MIRILSIGTLVMGCTPINQQLHVQTEDGVVLPVQVRGSLDANQTLVLYETGGPFGGGLEERVVDYQSFSDTLEPHYAIAYYDRRGYGNKNGNYRPEDITLDLLASDLDDVLRVLDDRYAPERVVLMGHSWGGFITAKYLTDHPDADIGAWIPVAGAVLSGEGDSAYIPYRVAFVCRLATDQLADGDSDALWVDIDAWCATSPEVDPVDWNQPARRQLSAYLNQIYERIGDPSIDAGRLVTAVLGSSYNVTDSLLTPNKLSRPISEQSEAVDLLSALPSVDVPTLFVTGEFDDIVPTEVGADVVAAMPHAELLEIEGGGHYVTWPDPVPFADAVRAFLD